MNTFFTVSLRKNSIHVILALLALFIVLLPFGALPLYAQTGAPTQSISGDEVCGQWDGTQIVKRCDMSQVGEIVKRVLTYVVALGLPILVVFVVYRFVLAWFALREGNANAYKEALKKSTNAVLGFLFIIALFGGLLAVFLRYLTVNEQYFKILKMFTEVFVSSAYAQSQATTSQVTTLPNPLGVNSLYDFLMAGLRLIMRFFIYPAVIVAWVWTGLAFVMAQGNPTKLENAKKWLVGVFITTIVIFMVQAFITALSGSVKKILSTSSQVEKRLVVNQEA